LQNKAEVFFRLYRQRQQLARDLKERTETLRWNEMFSALLAHDLRSPLSAILASAELLQRRSSDKAAMDMAARITLSGNRMARLIEDMLDLARARLGGGIPVMPRPTDLAVLAEPLVREQQLAAPQRSIEWQCSGDTSGHWDPERVAQVIANLLGNALKHGETARPVKVALDGSQSHCVAFTVSNGGSIPPALKPHLFDAFRGRQHEGRQDGLGLGLYIVAQIVAAHHGTVALDPATPGETCFRVVLPRHVPG
jgi:signal transduction histidine kinase